MNSRELKFTFAGFLAAAVVPALMFGLLTPVTTSWGPVNTDVVSVFALAVPGYFYSSFAAAVFGVPAFLVFRRYNLIRWWSTILAGLAVGAGLSLLFTAPQIQWQAVAIWSFSGALAAWVFWLVWRNAAQPGAQAGRRKSAAPLS